MYTIDELQVRLLSELREIADEMNLKNYKKLNKTDLIYKILDQQAVLPEDQLPEKKAPASEKKSSNGSQSADNKDDKKDKQEKSAESQKSSQASRKRKRVNVTETGEEDDDTDSQSSKSAADELMESFNVEVEGGKKAEKGYAWKAEGSERALRGDTRDFSI